MKNTIVLTVFLCVVTSLSAQFRIGVKGNYNHVTASESTINLSIADPVEILDLHYLSTSNNYSYGVSLYNEKDIIFLNADVLYKRTSQDFRLNNLISEFKRDNAVKDITYNRTDISLPISAGFKFNNIKIGGGPIANYMIGSDSNLTDVDNITANESKLQMGFQFLLGYIINDRIHLDLKRELSFTSVGDNFSYTGRKIEMKNSPHSISLGIGIYL